MNIQYMSDGHLDHSYAFPDDVEIVGDVVVVAGDLSSKGRGAGWLNAIAERCKAVIFVPGNHDYWGRRLDDFKFNSKEEPLKENVHVLLSDSITIDGVLFIGATLWTDFDGDDAVLRYIARSAMTDYRFIKQSESFKRVFPEDILVQHYKERDYITKMLSDFDKGRTVVVTHHAPSFLSADSHYSGDTLTPCYCSALDHLVDRKGLVWIHGHIHQEKDYMIGEGRVLCNPRGYNNEPIRPRSFSI